MSQQEWMDQLTAEWIEWNVLWQALKPRTLQGQRYKKELKPFVTGQEEVWQEEIKICRAIEPLVHQTEKKDQVEDAFRAIKDPMLFLQLLRKGESGNVTDWFELKQFLWEARIIFRELAHCHPTLADEVLKMEQLLEQLQPEQKSFDLAELNPLLRDIKQMKIMLAHKLDERREEEKKKIEEELGLSFVGANQLFISKKDQEKITHCLEHQQLKKERETPFEIIFSLLHSEEVTKHYEKLEELEVEWNRKEKRYLEKLARDFYPDLERMERWNHWIGEWDWRWSKVTWLKEKEHCWPSFNQDRLVLCEGKYLPLYTRLIAEGKDYTPTSITISYGLSTIIGSNMGGKSVALKTIGFLVALAHYGLPIPAKEFSTPLFEKMIAIHGDQQSVSEGVSTFGSEMLRVAQYIEGGNQLLFLDELARGTNPYEGEALAFAIGEHLSQQKEQMSLMVSHFSKITSITEAKHFQVKGLEEEGQINYILIENEGGEVPRHALRIAESLGVSANIIKRAKSLLEEGERHGEVRFRPTKNRSS